ncbi:hypothetical protein GNI_007820, partial [Gregarina niphandrodes]
MWTLWPALLLTVGLGEDFGGAAGLREPSENRPADAQVPRDPGNLFNAARGLDRPGQGVDRVGLDRPGQGVGLDRPGQGVGLDRTGLDRGRVVGRPDAEALRPGAEPSAGRPSTFTYGRPVVLPLVDVTKYWRLWGVQQGLSEAASSVLEENGVKELTNQQTIEIGRALEQSHDVYRQYHAHMLPDVLREEPVVAEAKLYLGHDNFERDLRACWSPYYGGTGGRYNGVGPGVIGPGGLGPGLDGRYGLEGRFGAEGRFGPEGRYGPEGRFGPEGRYGGLPGGVYPVVERGPAGDGAVLLPPGQEIILFESIHEILARSLCLPFESYY